MCGILREMLFLGGFWTTEVVDAHLSAQLLSNVAVTGAFVDILHFLQFKLEIS